MIAIGQPPRYLECIDVPLLAGIELLFHIAKCTHILLLNHRTGREAGNEMEVCDRGRLSGFFYRKRVNLCWPNRANVLFIRGRILPEDKNPISRFFVAIYRPIIQFTLRRPIPVMPASRAPT